MAFDPKVLVDATKKIEQHLKNYEARRKEYEDRMTDVRKRLEALDHLTEAVSSRSAALLKSVAAAGETIQRTLREVEACEQLHMKSAGDYEQVQRRYLDAKKTFHEAAENLNEKMEAARKNKDDKKARMELELAEKAAIKIATDTQKLEQQAQEIVPTKLQRGLLALTEELPKDVQKYEEALKALLQNLNWQKFNQAVQDLERYGRL